MTRLRRVLQTIIFTLFVLSLLTPSLTLAQVGLTGDSIQMTIEPQFPSSNQEVTLKLESFSIDLNKSDIGWYRSDKLLERGIGKKSIKLMTTRDSSSFTVRAVIRTIDGVVLEKNLTVRPADVDLVWESNGYVPPFYKGKAQYVHQAEIKVVAMAQIKDRNGNVIPPSRLIYRWTKDASVMGNESGYGKNSIVFRGNILTKPTYVQVEVTSLDNADIKAVASQYIESTLPRLITYYESPLYGILFNKAVRDPFELSISEARLTTVPYFFSSARSDERHLQYSWIVNGRKITEDKPSVVLKNSKNEKGVATVEINIENSRDILQASRDNFRIILNEASNREGVFDF